jgi:hypothetical protein
MYQVSTSAIVGNTTGTDLLESHLEQLAIVPEFQGHFGYDAFVAAIWFSTK